MIWEQKSKKLCCAKCVNQLFIYVTATLCRNLLFVPPPNVVVVVSECNKNRSVTISYLKCASCLADIWYERHWGFIHFCVFLLCLWPAFILFISTMPTVIIWDLAFIWRLDFFEETLWCVFFFIQVLGLTHVPLLCFSHRFLILNQRRSLLRSIRRWQWESCNQLLCLSMNTTIINTIIVSVKDTKTHGLSLW